MFSRLLCAPLALVLVAGCGGKSGSATELPTKELFLIDDNPQPTDVPDLSILRHRAAMGQHAEVRELIQERLIAASATAPDPGRDSLRRLAIELALTEGDAQTAAAELTILEGDIERLGPAASPETRAIVSLLYSELAYRGNYFLDARRWSLRAVSQLEGTSSALQGDALTTLARSQLALNNPSQALEVLSEATRALKLDRTAEYADLHEALLLKVDILLALQMSNEAIIAAGDVYDGAIESFGGESIPHAEALLAVAAATYAAGSADAARTMFADAKEIFFAVQTRQAASPFPVSERLVLRLSQLSEVLAKTPPSPAGAAPPELAPASPSA